MTTTTDTVLLKVQRILTGHFQLKVSLVGEQLVVRFADQSTIGTVTVVPRGSSADSGPKTYVHIDCPILFDVPCTPALYEWVARNACERWIGGIRMQAGSTPELASLSMVYTLVGDTLDPVELGAALLVPLHDADQLDDELKAQFGGKTFADMAGN